MLKRELVIANRLGLHARASAKLTKLASEFACDIWLSKGSRRVNAKSIMGVMMLAAGQGSKIGIEAEGPDAQEALDQIGLLVDDKFGEGQ